MLADLDGAPSQISLGALSPPTTDGKVAGALVKIADAIAPQVTAQLASDDPKVRALAVSVIAKLESTGKPRGADAAIKKAMLDSADQVRAAAMNAIVTVAQRRGTAPAELIGLLSRTLESAPWADQRVAALALGKLGASGNPAALLKAAGDRSSWVRSAVASVLGPAIPGSTDTLLTLSRDANAQVRAAAARSLAQVKDERAKKRRAELASDPDPVVKRAASEP